MGYSASRLTLYAVLSAIENDLRRIIEDQLSPCIPSEKLLGPDLLQRAHERLNKDLGGEYQHPTTVELLPYIDYADSYGLLNQHGSSLPANIAKYIKSVSNRLDTLVPIRNRVAHARPLHFDDLANVLDLADSLITTNAPLWRTLKETKDKLNADPSFVLGLTIPNYELRDSDLRHNLPQPDFDETGFLGREQQVADVMRLCLGPYPVVTLSGEGGIGKTALALKTAYDLLDLPSSPFEAVVWTTSKTTALTAHEIVRIQGAISDSLGVFQNVAEHLAGEAKADPLAEILTYLEEFKILLILDNLETVLDDNIRQFLQKMPTGSKILITSRIGLGAFEFPYKVPAFRPGESVQLLRALAKIRSLPDLVRISTAKLESYCERMQNNPGWIKWFVSAVRAGSRPEEVLEKSDVFLDFCMSNVYGFLTPESKKVLGSMLAVPGSYSQAELAFLNGIDALDLQRCLQLLLTTNFVVMNSIPMGSSFESKYAVSELGREFLQKHHPPTPSEHSEFTRKKRLLVAAGEQIKLEEKSNPFSFESIVTRSASDLIVARYLLDALRFSKRERFSDADKAIQTAKNLAPSYFEVHRVEALVRVAGRNYSAAREAYERAIEYEPCSAALRFWFGNFLLRYADDVEEATIQLKEALRLAPEAPEPKTELARAYIYRSQFDDAGPLIDSLLKDVRRLSEWTRRKLFDLVLMFYQRRADYHQARHDWAAALSDLESLRRSFTAIPAASVDSRMRYKLAKALPTADQCRERVLTEEQRSRASDVVNWMIEAAGDELRDKRARAQKFTLTDVHCEGKVTKVCTSFGFIAGESAAAPVFFHRTNLVRRSDWRILKQGSIVRYRRAVDERGRSVAAEVEVLARPTSAAG